MQFVLMLKMDLLNVYALLNICVIADLMVMYILTLFLQ